MTLTHTPARTVNHPDRYTDEDTGQEYIVFQDTDAEDPRTWIEDKHVGLWAFCEPPNSSSTAADMPENNAAINAFARYYKHTDAEAALHLTQRYLAAFHPQKRIRTKTVTIRGYSQSDWLEVIAAVEDGFGTPEDHIAEYRMWAFGNVWTVLPDAKPGVSGIYAETPEEAVEHFRSEAAES